MVCPLELFVKDILWISVLYVKDTYYFLEHVVYVSNSIPTGQWSEPITSGYMLPLISVFPNWGDTRM
jgi:hypothetical protein